jgi:hypothetical protein
MMTREWDAMRRQIQRHFLVVYFSLWAAVNLVPFSFSLDQEEEEENEIDEEEEADDDEEEEEEMDEEKEKEMNEEEEKENEMDEALLRQSCSPLSRSCPLGMDR